MDDSKNKGATMYIVHKRIEIAGSHSLKLPYKSKCENLHGHNWIIDIEVSATELDKNGMVLDFTHIKQCVTDKLDHKHLNNVVDVNPTAENLAKWIADAIDLSISYSIASSLVSNISAGVSKVTVQESEGNVACYIP